MLPLEIERKFLLAACPATALLGRVTRIEQGWIPGRQIRERVRRRTAPDGTVRFWRTVKFGPPEARVELEDEIDAVLFEALWPLTREARIRKQRHEVPDGPLTWEIDVFEDRALVLAEVEVPTWETPVVLPEWLRTVVVAEVTGDPAFHNAAMARPDPEV